VSPHKRNIATYAGNVALGFLVASALFGGVAARAFPEGSAPSVWFLGARATTVTAIVVGAVATLVGLALGASAALGPRVIDSLLSRAIEMAAGVPSVVVALVVARMAPAAFIAVPVTLAVLRGLETAKVVRRELITLSATEFAVAAMALGSTRGRLFRKHLFPHVIGAALASGTLTAAAVVGLEAALAFLGLASLGPSWGAMLAVGLAVGDNAGLTAGELSGRAAGTGVLLAPALGLSLTLASLHVLGARIEARFSVGRTFL
jgi:ABC-type antimicrobial peptide transport system permease subunit